MQRKLLLFLGMLCVAIFAISLASAANNCTGATYNFTCGSDINESCTMNGNMSSAGTCFNITVDNVILDCNNNWINHSISSGGRGIKVIADNVTVKRCVIYQANSLYSAYGMSVDTSSRDNITNNSIVTQGSDTAIGIRVTSASNNNSFSYNEINTTGSTSCFGMWISSNSVNNNITDSRIYPLASDSVRVDGENTSIRDSILNTSSYTSYNIIVGNSVTLNVTNCSFEKTSDINQMLGVTNVFWYVDSYVNDSLGNIVGDANLSFYNQYNILMNKTTSVADGYTPRVTLRGFMENTTSRYYDSNYTINSTNGTYFNYQTFNLTTNRLNATNNFFVTFDRSFPQVAYSSPTPVNGTTQTGSKDVTVNVSVTDTDSYPWRAWMTFNASTYNNQTWVNGTNLTFKVYNLPNANYTYNVTVCDLAGNCNTTGTYQINISNGDIGIYISYPTEGLSLSSTSFPILINMTYSVTYVGTVNCTYNVTGTSTQVPTTDLDCAQGYQPFYVSLPGNYVISIYSNNTADGKFSVETRSFTATLIATPGTPGGGGPSYYTCNNETQKWNMKTDRGGSSQYLLMLKGDERTTRLLIYNLGTTPISIDLECVAQEASDICNYVSFSNASLTILPNSLNPTDVDVIVNLKDYPNTNFTKFIFTINADDGVGCVGKVDYVIQQSALGAFFTLDVVSEKVQSAFELSLFGKSYQIPHWLLMILIVTLSVTIGIILQNQPKYQHTNSALWSFIIGLGLVLIYILILVFLI